MKALSLAALAMSLLILGTGCNRDAPEPAAQTVSVPASLFISSSAAEAVPLAAAKTDAKVGDRVVFEARVGGRRAAFVENRAIFFVADSSLESCDQIPGDSCKYPWDYCCETQESRTKNMATVQVVDAGGQPLKTSLEDTHGLAPLKTIVVVGTVGETEGGNFVVNAETIHVKEG